MGGGGSAETCHAERPCRRDTACPALPWRSLSGEEAEGLVLTLPADPLLPPRSRGGPGLRLRGIAPTRLLEAAMGKTCTLGMRGTSEATTDEKKREMEIFSSSSESSGLHVRSKGEKRTNMQFSYHCSRY